MARDVIQLIAWAVFGVLITWGIFLAWIGFRSTPAYRDTTPDNGKRTAVRAAAVAAFGLGVFWIMLWVTSVVYNLIQIIGSGELFHV